MRDAYDALRALNLELARLPESVSSPTIGQLRVQFWRDTVDKVFAGQPPREPISLLLHRAVSDLAARDPSHGAKSLRFWLLRLIGAREKYMDLRPYPSLAALEDYAENTYSTLLYLTMACVPHRSTLVDHIASHIGKACGIVAVLKGVSVLSAPSRRVQSPTGAIVADGRKPALLLPLDVMADAGVREEDVFRKGGGAPGLQDAVFRVATRAHDHLVTARELLADARAGRHPSHSYEYADEPQHMDGTTGAGEGCDSDLHVRRVFGILLAAVPAQNFLDRLQSANFDPFAVTSRSWKLPWGIWKALKRQEI